MSFVDLVAWKLRLYSTKMICLIYSIYILLPLVFVNDFLWQNAINSKTPLSLLQFTGLMKTSNPFFKSTASVVSAL